MNLLPVCCKYVDLLYQQSPTHREDITHPHESHPTPEMADAGDVDMDTVLNLN